MDFLRVRYKNFILVILLAAVISFSGGYLLAQYKGDFITSKISNRQTTFEKEANFKLFWDTLDTIEEKYLNRGGIDYDKLLYGAISGMVGSLEDPYTVFLSPDDLKDFKESIDGTFEGIGAEIGIKNEVLTVISPLENSPAQKSGLRPGDKILKINEELTIDMTVEKAVDKIRGPKGTVVSLLISREGLVEPKQIQIERNIINVPSIKWSAKDENIAYIQLFRFGPDTAGEFTEIAKEINNNQKIKKIILDVRNNPGGFLESSVQISNLFLPDGKLVVTEDYGDGKKDEFKTSGKPLLDNYPMVVLMNKGTASAAEILAGALRDQKGVNLIGETTFGKGSVQELETLKGGNTALKITVARWLTPSGKSINEEGLKPDIEQVMSQEDYDQNKDPQLDKAIEIIKGK